MASKMSATFDAKSSPETLWDALHRWKELYPRLFPDIFKNIEVVAGDGWSAGTINLVTYQLGDKNVTSKEKTEVADEENKMVSYSVIDGDLLRLYKSLKVTARIEPQGDGSLVIWNLNYEKNSEEVPEPEFYKEATIKIFNGLDAHLIAGKN